MKGVSEAVGVRVSPDDLRQFRSVKSLSDELCKRQSKAVTTPSQISEGDASGAQAGATDIFSAKHRAADIDIRALVALELKGALGMGACDALSEVRDFLDLGLDSILESKFMKGVSDAVGVHVSPDDLRQFRSVNSLSDELCKRQSKAVTAPSQRSEGDVSGAQSGATEILSVKHRAADIDVRAQVTLELKRALGMGACDSLSEVRKFLDLGLDSILENTFM